MRTLPSSVTRTVSFVNTGLLWPMESWTVASCSMHSCRCHPSRSWSCWIWANGVWRNANGTSATGCTKWTVVWNCRIWSTTFSCEYIGCHFGGRDDDRMWCEWNFIVVIGSMIMHHHRFICLNRTRWVILRTKKIVFLRSRLFFNFGRTLSTVNSPNKLLWNFTS